ncbi:hypothetical protein KC340_g4551 [Hortaea werneckii]|nr:hypothetical protein KC342_g11910 [Hortaea werneckii]KAI7329688.1 hypothetical protein KC340_g4551 [Hortaea werneckii]KAI7360621.1 hypothetical protein KC354_g8716 [Hortaea werneckii]KAI7404844.1 hypothetical protein KC328_g1736 [Hortaea werneckii]KAI7486574.1 hypothetical protein KC351_g3220 [Hortaea werneckii]
MAENKADVNPLVTTKAPETTLSVQLHPLVLLTISDYITRHTLRQQQGPVVGAIIGQQNGRNFTLENAFECKLAEADGNVVLDREWFAERLEQYKDVHKAPALDLVALFTMAPVEGPQAVHLPVLKQVQEMTNTEGIMMLLFHGSMVDQLQGGKLPISLWETVHEQDGQTKFRELSFEVETGDAEMIGVDFVAKGGGNATAVPKVDTTQSGESSKDKKSKNKGKAKEKEDDAEDEESATTALSAEDEELIASLNAKANAIKMLNQRINLIRSYLETLPQSYLTDSNASIPPPDTTNHTLLRSINSMLSRVPLLAPPTVAHETASSDTVPSQPLSSIAKAGEKERQDVHLTALLAALTRSVSEASTMGTKFQAVTKEKQAKERTGNIGRGGRGMGGMGGMPGGYAEEGRLGEAGGVS